MHQVASLAEPRHHRNLADELQLLPHASLTRALDPSNFAGQCQASQLPKILSARVKDCLVTGPTSWFRSFHEMYNHSLALQVVLHLAQDFPDVRLIMIGLDRDDGSFQATKKLTMKLGGCR